MLEKGRIGEIIRENFTKHFSHIADKKDIELLSEAVYSLLNHKMDSLSKLGERLFLSGILLSHFFYIFEKVVSLLEGEKKNLRLENMLSAKRELAKGYIKEELKFDKHLFERYKNRKIAAESKELSEALNMHTSWIINFINSILDGTIYENSELDSWIDKTQQTEIPNLDNNTYKKINNSLKETAKRLLKAYRNGEYFYFSVLYREFMGYSSKMQNMLILNFMSEEIISIYTDYLTGLDNQFKLKKDLKKYADKYLLLIDISNFREINISYGFDTGDKILKHTAEVLKSIENCRAYRFIGDEFAVIIDSKEKSHKILKSLESMTFTINHHTISLFFYGALGKIKPNILELAEYGLIKTKKLKNHIIDLEESEKNNLAGVSLSNKDLLSINAQLKVAVASDKIVPYLQGIFDACNLSKPAKYEALMRIRFKEKTITPKEFLSILKNTYLYFEATKIMFLKCVDVIERRDIEINFNLSVLDIINQNTTKFLKTILLKKPEIAQKITFEITEEEAIENFREVKKFISDIKKLGVKIAIDDFGSGYANYSYIFNMNPDYIKIDGNLVSEILTNDKQVVFIKSLVDMCKNIGIKTVAEFVDSKEKIEKLEKLGIDYFQGFYLHKPEPCDKL
ncbi:EAL domain-containing protein [Hippea alviniae]|uniref:EAL domain-containing protein n=1 Tax=Hippea alviniae TaxID=1279027 RepID=UPI0004168B7E|nr:EAL domain-containing protein [Hippea alviniae]